MLDFEFYSGLSLEEIKRDENLKIVEDDNRIIIELANVEDTGMWTYQVGEEYVWKFEGHDEGVPVAMYIYQKYGVPFSTDEIYYFQEALRRLEKQYCLSDMLRYFNDTTKVHYKSLYEKIQRDLEEVGADIKRDKEIWKSEIPF